MAYRREEMKAIVNTIMNKPDHDCRYTRGMLPLGKVVAAQITYVGNAMHGWKSVLVIIRDSNGLWVCFPKPTQKGDFASYRLDANSPKFVKKAAGPMLESTTESAPTTRGQGGKPSERA